MVTAIEFDLYPAPHLYGGRMLWPADRAAEVFAAFRETTGAAPDELSSWFELVQLPPIPQLPEPLRGLSAVIVDGAFLGTPDEGQDLLLRFDAIDGRIMDTRGPLAVADLGSISAEPTDPVRSDGRAELVTDLTDAAAATFMEQSLGSAGTVAPLIGAQLRHLGGRLATAPPGEGACGHIDEPYLLFLVGPASDDVTARLAEFGAAMTPHTTGRKPFTMLAAGERAANAFSGDTLARLRDIKRHSDPRGVFRSNFPVQN